MSYKKLSYEMIERVAYVGFGHNTDKAMTVLDEELLTELNDVVDEISTGQKNLDGAIFFTHKDRCFIAGADINLISAMKTESDGSYGSEQGQQIFNKIEDLKIPTIACVHGACLGGGLELALSCNKIIVSDDSCTVMGLPEVKLGLIPGFGGTYRLPKAIGLVKALDLILSGKMVPAKKAKRLGIAVGIYPVERLKKMALTHFAGEEKKKSLKDSIEILASENFLSKKIIFQKARENVFKLTKGFYQAPLKILDTMEAGMMKGRSSYLSSEAQAFGELCVSEQSKNLQHIFFMTERVKKYAGPKGEGKIPQLDRGGVFGAGTMGGGIAWLMASQKMMPLMKDLNKDGLELGFKQSSENFRGAVKRKKMTQDEFERLQRSIIGQMDYEGFKRVDLVIEAIVENIDIKKKVFAESEEFVRDDTLLTSNTSSLSVEAMASALKIPQRFCGLHFFNPVHRMPLVEIIMHSKVAPETVEALYHWVLKAKKTPVIVKDGPGFLVNRILAPYMNEAGYLLEEGVSMKDIDEACLNFGMPMGPCRLLDEVGIDVGGKVSKILEAGLGPRAKGSKASEELVKLNLLGRKTGKGFYIYDEMGKVTEENDEIKKIFPAKKKAMSEVDIQMRVFLPMINEAAMVLEDKIVDSAHDIDLGLIFGIGFPPFRGGLLRYADSEGPQRILEALQKRAETVDAERFKPASLLERIVREKRKFYEL